ncbi:urease accessory protein UreD [Piscinibacter koreensis]|uniref:Urease accessory protein UreD n=1 Tax=Piscinibacter koreensis TaxID=2742824 RepID=A0A7Y6TXB7_9BURK|nr:urease accessory protein UreD [Schlegelella koreensis]NUZ06932.1 urease accessory protein UreD [Schlegelella koreensis]
MGWRGHLQLNYRVSDTGRSVLHATHSGPLRVLKSLYPEGDARCHSVLVHPPGGVVGGDVLEIDLDLASGAQALVTTPGATRFYRSAGAPALQALNARVAGAARLEWLPLETIAHSGCLATNRMRFDLDAGAEMIGWDVLALGLPAADQPFARGRFTQRIELPGRWLDQGTVDAADRRLLDSPLGWAGRRVLATLWFAAGSALASERRTRLVDAARDLANASSLAPTSGATAPQPGVVVLRALAARVEPAMGLLVDVWRAWRDVAWGLEGEAPRIWRT